MTHVIPVAGQALSSIDTPFNEEYYKKIEWLARALKERSTFGERHFDELEELIDAFAKHPALIVQSQTNVNVGSRGVGQRAINRILTLFHHADGYPQVVTTAFGMNAKLLNYAESWFPLSLDLRYLGYSHLKETAHLIEGDDNRNIQAMSLAIARVLERNDALQEKLLTNEGVPVFLFDDRALYKCRAHTVPAGSAPVNIALRRGKNGSLNVNQDISGIWQPRVNIVATACLSRVHLNLKKGGVLDIFDDLLNDKLFQDAMYYLYSRYMNPFIDQNAEIYKAASVTGSVHDRGEEKQETNLAAAVKEMLELVAEGPKLLTYLDIRLDDLMKTRDWAWMTEEYEGSYPAKALQPPKLIRPEAGRKLWPVASRLVA